jgi:hypothetical protein
MRNRTYLILLWVCLLLSMPAWAAAQPGSHEGSQADSHFHHGELPSGGSHEQQHDRQPSGDSHAGQHGGKHSNYHVHGPRGEGAGRHGHPELQPPEIDWSVYPAEFQTYKNQLDQLKAQQKGMFEQFKLQRKQIRDAHRKLSEAKRAALRTELKDLIDKLKTTRHDIQMLNNQKLAAWDLFSQHAAAKQWDAAKLDLQAVIARKKEILAKQQTLLDTQKQIIGRLRS